MYPYIALGQFTSWYPVFNSFAAEKIAPCSAFQAAFAVGNFLAGVLPADLVAPHVFNLVGCDETELRCGMGWVFAFAAASAPNDWLGYARHTLTFTRNEDNDTTTVTHWEKAAGPSVAAFPIDWTNALQEGLLDFNLGMICLQRVYQATGTLDPTTVTNSCLHFDP